METAILAETLTPIYQITGCYILEDRALNIHRRQNLKYLLSSQIEEPLGKPWHRWRNSIQMDLKEVGWGNGPNYFGSG